ncbi:MAG: hypothetical protein ACJ74Y_08865 [Bryobacteraceae bacterium]
MQAEQQRPYHVQAIYDLQADYSTSHFRFAIGECRKVVAQLIADGHSSDQQIARVHILRYLDLQLSRATAWADGEADLLAMVLRSEIELRGWAEFVSESPEQATRFLNDEVVIDANELDEKMRKAFPSATFAEPLNISEGYRR